MSVGALVQTSIVIPTYNEASTIGILLEEIRTKLNGKVQSEIIVVDDNSADGTYMIAKEAGVKTIRLQKNVGFGGALKIGFSNSSMPTLVAFDASGEYDPALIVSGLNHLRDANADIAVAFYPTRSFMHKVGSMLIAFQLRLLFNLRVDGDLSSAFICLKKEVLDRVNVTAMDFTFVTELLIKSNARGFKIVEFPIKGRRRLNTKPKRTFMQGFQYLRGFLRNNRGGV